MRWTLLLVFGISGCRAIEYPMGSVEGPIEATTLSWGGSHACGSSAGGSWGCWGRNVELQLGAPIGVRSLIPVLPETGPIELNGLVGGAAWTCGLDGAQRAWCFGGGGVLPRLAGGGRAFVELQGGEFFCGREADGEIWCWDGASGLEAPVIGSEGFTSWHVGGQGCGIGADSTVSCWGLDGVLSPVPGAVKFLSVSVGGGHQCGIGVDGRARCWGDDDVGQLGNGPAPGSTSPALVATPVNGDTLVEVHAGHGFSCAVATTGRVYCWGFAGMGGIGVGYFAGIEGTSYASPISVNPGPLVVGGLAVRYRVVCGSDAAGDLWCWGGNEDGQLGTGVVGTVWSPTLALTSPAFLGEGSP